MSGVFDAAVLEEQLRLLRQQQAAQAAPVVTQRPLPTPVAVAPEVQQAEAQRIREEEAAVKQPEPFKEIPNKPQYIDEFTVDVEEVTLGTNTSGIAEGSVRDNYFNALRKIFPAEEVPAAGLGIGTTLGLRGFGGKKKDFQIIYKDKPIKFVDLGFGFNPGPYDPTLTRVCRVLSLDIFRTLVTHPAFASQAVFWQKIKSNWKFPEDWIFCYIGSLSLLLKTAVSHEVKVRCAALNAVLALANSRRQKGTLYESIPLNKWMAFMRISEVSMDEVSAYLAEGLIAAPTGAIISTDEFEKMIQKAVTTAKSATNRGHGMVTWDSKTGQFISRSNVFLSEQSSSQ